MDRSPIGVCAVSAGLVFLCSSARAQDDTGLSPEEQAELEKAAAADTAALAASQPPPATPALSTLLPDIAVITDVAFAWFSEDENLQQGGHDPAENGFTLQQVELALGKNVDPYFRYDANLVFHAEGVEVEEAYATTLALPARLQLRAGQFLTRFGRINATHPHAWDFVDQAFPLSRIFGGEGNRGLGLEVSWLSPLPWYLELVGSMTDARGEGTARSFFGAADERLQDPLDLQATLAIKQFFPLSDDWSLSLGLSGAAGPNASGHDNRSEVAGVDLYLKYRPITRASDTVVALQAEYFYRRRQVPGDVLVDHNAYAYLSWRFAKRWATAVRYEIGSGVDGDDLDPEWTSARQRFSANLSFWPTEFSRLRGQVSLDRPGWQDDPILAFMLAAEFVIGAHGAHQF